MAEDLPPCPFCGGQPRRRKYLVEGREPDEIEAYQFYVICMSCAAQGGWAKTETGGDRLWRARQAQEHVSMIEAGIPRDGPMLPRYTDGELLALYQLWSEERYAAGFMHPTPALVRKFREWAWARLAGPEALPNGPGPQTDYEREMLAEFRRQERQ